MLRPGEIELTVRNDGLDPVRIAQVTVNDAFADFRAESGGGPAARREGDDRLPVDRGRGLRGRAAHVSSGATLAHEIPVAVETPSAGAGFWGLMTLLGVYVGIIPIALGMLWLPFLQRLSASGSAS